MHVTACISFAFVYFLLNMVAGAKAEIKTEVLDNGCNITRHFGNGSEPKISWYGMPLPHINCSGSSQTRFEVTGVIEDAKSITLSHNDMIEFHLDDLKELTELLKIDLASNKLQRVLPTSKKLVFSSVMFLSLSNNKLEDIPNDALKAFPNLIFLQIYNNEITTIRNDDFAFNPKLAGLYLGPNPIEDFNDEWLSNSSIYNLNLRGCGLTNLPSRIADMKKTIRIDLSDNAITEIPANSFTGCSQLIWLELASNQISTIHDDAFKGAEKLSNLDLSDNRLTTLSPKTFDTISKEYLEIDMYENLFNCNCNMAAFKQWALDTETLDMSTEIRFKCIQPLRNHGKSFKELPLKNFSCEANDVSWEECAPDKPDIPATSPTPVVSTASPPRTCPQQCTCFDEKGDIYFPTADMPPNKKSNKKRHWIKYGNPRVDCVDTKYSTLPANIPDDVSTIVITRNPFTKLGIKQLGRFKNLQTLVLTRNNITVLTPDPSTSLVNLKKVVLSFNKIKSITKSHLESFPNLEIFSFRHNSVTKIPIDLFALNRKLQRLYLGPNPVTDFQEDFMKTLSLKSLSLRNMSLKTAPKSLRNLVNLTYVDLSENLITNVGNGTFSKCAMLWRIDLENNRISTIGANAFNGATNIASIDLSENELQTLPATVFANVTEEKLAVDLWENPFVCDCKMKGFKSFIEKAEADNPSMDIRFRCHNPLRVHDKTSDQLPADEFLCKDGDTVYINHESICPTSNPAGKIALSILLTFLCTVVLCIIAWRCTFKRRYGDLLTYAKQRTTYDDMEELQ